jgi:tetratricopeptide (TPR) repeat protein
MAKRKAARVAAAKSRPQFPEWVPYAAALAALAAAVYANSIGNGFVGDDKIQILKNPLITEWTNLPRIFGSGVWAFLGYQGNYYRPLQFLIYLLLYECAGFHAGVFHAAMMLLHAGNTVLLYLLVRRLAEGRVAVAAAALFAVHPIHTETVDWIAAMPDLALTTLVLAGVLWLVHQDGAPRGPKLLGHSFLYLLALLTKETGVMLLPLYAGLGFLCMGRGWQEFRRNAGLYAAMAGALGIYLAMRRAALGSLVPGQETFFHLSPVEFALSAVVTAGRYLMALVLPVNLNYFHVFQATRSVSAEFLIALLALAALAAILIYVRSGPIAYGIFWIAVTLAPPLNLTGVGLNVFAERYLYLPSAGFCWIAGFAWSWLAGRQPQWGRIGGVAVLLACAVEAVARNADWRDDFTLLQITVQQSPTSGWVHDTLAGAYVERNSMDKALEQERLAVQYEPRSPVFRRKLGYLLLAGDPREAVVEFRKVVELAPAVAQSHCDLGLALEAAGDAKGAAAEYARALELAPELEEAAQGYQRVGGNGR